MAPVSELLCKKTVPWLLGVTVVILKVALLLVASCLQQFCFDSNPQRGSVAHAEERNLP
jgi:hypothetical protein